MSIGMVLGWKFNHAPGIRTREGEIIAWPENLGPLPTAEQIAQWTAEYESRPTYREKRKAAYIAELGEKPDFTETVGDVFDVLIKEVRALADRPATAEFRTLTDKIDAIKARFPKE